MARLIINSPDGKRGILELKKSVVTIGRGSANDLVLNDNSVSRFHAVIKLLENDVITIADRGSTNGVLINGERIPADTALNDGDAIKIGVYGLKFERFNDSALIVKKAEIPSTLNHVLRGELQLSLRSEAVAANTSPSAMLQSIRKLERENYLLTVLYDAGKALNSKLSIDDIATQVMELSFRIEGVERGFMMLFNKKGEVWRETEVKYRDAPAAGAVDQPRIIFSQTILERIKKEPQPILITDASEDERFSESESLKISGLRSAMCAPLVGSQRLFGILYVDNMQRKAAFTQEELNVFSLVATQAANAIDNAAAHEQLAESAVQRSALERFLSPDVVEMIAADPTGVKLGGINQKVSVMFADIRGFTSLSERMAPEKIVEVLNEYFTRVTDVIFDNGGTLDKYIGDAVMAVFGAPISKGNDAVNAVKVAVEIQRLLVEMNRDASARGWPELKVGIGINTGIVTAGNIGSPRRIDYTVIGDAVNTASRLMSNAGPGQIIISKMTAEELSGKFAISALPPLKVKGKAEPLDAYSVEWKRQHSAVST
ncbi:MAG: Adenylate cyclase, family 3 (some protein containing domain) [Candidatus Angelobacter sp.]|jgi:adenylate cyclase|nr:Adenylate cyclase, family 3 (some protein containing domain) [Candidatus Angelobacter sp.]